MRDAAVAESQHAAAARDADPISVWLSRFGRPLDTLIFTILKLIALASAALTVTTLSGLLRQARIQAVIMTRIEPRYRDSYEQRDCLGYFVRKTIVITLIL